MCTDLYTKIKMDCREKKVLYWPNTFYWRENISQTTCINNTHVGFIASCVLIDFMTNVGEIAIAILKQSDSIYIQF